MRFNSLEFLLFMVAFFAVWPLLRRRRHGRWIYLTAASLFFYGWWDWRFIFLILASGLIDFLAALAMHRLPRWRKVLLVASLVGNLGALGTFKYLDFLLASVGGTLSFLGAGVSVPLARLSLPIGISFYTFQSMSYTIDVYRGRMEPTRNVFHFFAYLAMFPQLVAGPIVRARDLLPQLREVPHTPPERQWEGLKLIVFGYFKKVVIADNIAPAVDAAFGASRPMESGAYWWIILLMFAYQIYCDFSGYSDIARGLGKWLGYDYPVNFDHPYTAGSFREFWRRWHVSLSTWFRDYLYIPLGGSRRGVLLGHANLWITMLLAGLWHGAAWTFVAWGALHAAYLSIGRATQWPRRLSSLPGGRHAATVLVFLCVLVAWTFFRARSCTQAVGILALAGDVSRFDLAACRGALDPRAINLTLLAVAWQIAYHLGATRLRVAGARLLRLVEPVALAILIAACVYLRGPGRAFVYFRF
jgi:D-alanyl-lipoteichoic acid acyltransferase DltB (MBOAT superfamily)